MKQQTLYFSAEVALQGFETLENGLYVLWGFQNKPLPSWCPAPAS